MDTLPAKGKGVGLLLILLLTVFFANAAANPAVGKVQLPTVNLGIRILKTVSGHLGGFWKSFRVAIPQTS